MSFPVQGAFRVKRGADQSHGPSWSSVLRTELKLGAAARCCGPS